MLLPYFLLLVIGSYPATVEANKYRALRFGKSTADYIEWSPNMAPFTRQFSVCTWLKRRHQSRYPMVVNYNPNSHGMRLGDNGYYNYVVGSNINLQSEYNVPDGEWFHVCWLWSASSYTTTVYLNGEIIGSTATNERELRTGGTMCLGNYGGKSFNNIFGGDLFKINIYSRVLTATEIRNMASDICSNEEESLNSVRSLRWESIILQERSGSVTETTVCSPEAEEIEAERRAKMLRPIEERLETFESRLQNTEQELAKTKTNLILSDKKLENVSAKLANSEQELAETKSTLENVITSLTSTQNKLNDTEQELAETSSTLNQRVNQTEKKLQAVITTLTITQDELNATRQELAEERNSPTAPQWLIKKVQSIQKQLEAATKNKASSNHWDQLFSDRFFNKQLTREMAEDMESTCLELFIGANITAPFIQYLNRYYEHRETECT